MSVGVLRVFTARVLKFGFSTIARTSGRSVEMRPGPHDDGSADRARDGDDR